MFQRYFEINVIIKEFYIQTYGKGPENINVVTRENIIQRYVCRGFIVLDQCNGVGDIMKPIFSRF